MSTTYEEAIDMMYGKFTDTWEAEAAAIAGYLPIVMYEGVSDDKQAPQNRIWTRLSVRSVVERQSTIGTPAAPGQHQYESIGLLIVQLFLPRARNQSITKGRRLAQLVRNAYRTNSANGEVWFRDATIQEQPPGKRWYQINITIEYNFTEIV